MFLIKRAGVHACRAGRISDIDAALAKTCAGSQRKELIMATGSTVGKSRQAIVMANDVTHLGHILSGIGGDAKPKSR